MRTTFFYRIQRAKGIARWSMVTAKTGAPKQPEKPECAAPLTTFFREVTAECTRIGDDNVDVLAFQRTRKPKAKKAKKK